WAPNFVSTLLPHVEKVRNQVVNLLQDDAYLRAQEGDLHGALLSVRAMLNAGRSLGDEPVMITMLVRGWADGKTVATLDRVLAQGEVSASDLATMQELLEAEA